jgi:O-antigen/teichoic acid export membrane protein
MGGLKTLIGQIATYGLSSVLIRAVNFLLVPLYTAFLLPEQYGQISYLYAWAAFLNVILSLGIDTAYFRYASAEPEQEKTTYAASIQVVVVWSLSFLSLISISFYMIPLEYTMINQNHLFMLFQVVATDSLLVLPFARLRLQGKSTRFVMLKSGQVMLTLVLNLWWIYLPGVQLQDLPEWLPADQV